MPPCGHIAGHRTLLTCFGGVPSCTPAQPPRLLSTSPGSQSALPSRTPGRLLAGEELGRRTAGALQPALPRAPVTRDTVRAVSSPAASCPRGAVCGPQGQAWPSGGRGHPQSISPLAHTPSSAAPPSQPASRSPQPLTPHSPGRRSLPTGPLRTTGLDQQQGHPPEHTLPLLDHRCLTPSPARSPLVTRNTHGRSCSTTLSPHSSPKKSCKVCSRPQSHNTVSAGARGPPLFPITLPAKG